MSNHMLLLAVSNFHRLEPAVQEQIYRDFYSFLYCPILYLLQDHAATEDIIQETFLKVLAKPPNIDNEVQLKKWIKVVAKNATLSYLRKVKRSRVILQSHWEQNERFAASDKDSVEHQVELKSLEDTITYHIQTMRPDHRAILELKWKTGLSYKEIADHTKESEGAVRSKLHRARSYLKRMLYQEWRGLK